MLAYKRYSIARSPGIRPGPNWGAYPQAPWLVEREHPFPKNSTHLSPSSIALRSFGRQALCSSGLAISVDPTMLYTDWCLCPPRLPWFRATKSRRKAREMFRIVRDENFRLRPWSRGPGSPKVGAGHDTDSLITAGARRLTHTTSGEDMNSASDPRDGGCWPDMTTRDDDEDTSGETRRRQGQRNSAPGALTRPATASFHLRATSS